MTSSSYFLWSFSRLRKRTESQSSDPENANQQEQPFENVVKKEQFYENVDHAPPSTDDSTYAEVNPARGYEIARETDAMLPAQSAAQSDGNPDQFGMYESVGIKDTRSSCTSQTLDDDESDLYENVGTARKMAAAAVLQSSVKTDEPTRADTTDRVSPGGGHARDKGQIDKKPKPMPRLKKTPSKNKSPSIYVSMAAKGSGKRTRDRSRKAEKETAGKGRENPRDAETPEEEDATYVNPLPRMRDAGCRSNRSLAPAGLRYPSDLYDTIHNTQTQH